MMDKWIEAGIRRDYCAGVLTLRDVAARHEIPKTTLIDLAKRRGWNRKKQPPAKPDQNDPVWSDGNRSNVVPITGLSKTASGYENGLLTEDTIPFSAAEYGLSDRQARFVHGYVKTGSRVGAYRMAGYQGEGNTACVNASRMLRNAKVFAAVRSQQAQIRQRYIAELDELIHQLMSIARADANVLMQHRRVNCRHCWGKNHRYQYRDKDEYNEAIRKAAKTGNSLPGYGGTGFIGNMDPHPECPRCGGEGIGEVFFCDTRDLHIDDRHFYRGVRKTRYGVEILTADQDAARIMLIKIILGLRKSPTDVIPVSVAGSVDGWKNQPGTHFDVMYGGS